MGNCDLAFWRTRRSASASSWNWMSAISSEEPELGEIGELWDLAVSDGGIGIGGWELRVGAWAPVNRFNPSAVINSAGSGPGSGADRSASHSWVYRCAAPQWR